MFEHVRRNVLTPERSILNVIDGFRVIPRRDQFRRRLIPLAAVIGYGFSFEPWNRDNSYQSEVFGIPTAVISHDGGADDEEARKGYKKIVNDPIANALATIQLKLVPFSDEWNTGISVRHIKINEAGDLIFDEKINEYTRKVLGAEAL